MVKTLPAERAWYSPPKSQAKRRVTLLVLCRDAAGA
jgi:hypothetical protein